MKISNKLRKQINRVIIDEFNLLSDENESFFRNDETNHAVWKHLHSEIHKCQTAIAYKVMECIDLYGGKR